jgi:exopolysaccharide biosynthesis polyprenyl glycosylphosphotransferase
MAKKEIKNVTVIVFIGDFLVGFLGLMIGHWLRFKSGIAHISDSWWAGVSLGDGQSLNSYFGLILFGSILLSGTYLANGLYDSKNLLRFRFSIIIITRAIALWLALYLGLSLVLKFDPPISRLYAIGSALAVFIIAVMWRFAVLHLIRSLGFSSRLAKRVAFLGWSSASERLSKLVQEDQESFYSIVGYISEDVVARIQKPPHGLSHLGEPSDLNQILRSYNVDVLIRSDAPVDVDNLIEICNACDREMVEFKMIPTKFHRMITGLHVETIIDVPVLGVAEGPLELPLNRILKRLVDIVGAIVGLMISIPLFCIFGSLVYLESPGPILYRQTRVGRRGKSFEILKIRSMRLDAESKNGAQWAKKNDDRRLRIGALMRETNIDEVPQFWNVLKGDMSLVGPRPERPELISRFQDEIPHYNARHTVRPGITGWAQVNGWRGDTDLTERIRYDLYYIEKWTLLGDFMIMFRTLFSRKNAY